jgi:hypothetical protein
VRELVPAGARHAPCGPHPIDIRPVPEPAATPCASTPTSREPERIKFGNLRQNPDTKPETAPVDWGWSDPCSQARIEFGTLRKPRAVHALRVPRRTWSARALGHSLYESTLTECAQPLRFARWWRHGARSACRLTTLLTPKTRSVSSALALPRVKRVITRVFFVFQRQVRSSFAPTVCCHVQRALLNETS